MNTEDLQKIVNAIDDNGIIEEAQLFDSKNENPINIRIAICLGERIVRLNCSLRIDEVKQ